eukprot:scaffold152923_cov28-Tisochrysis_lutea.AAC.1
MEVCSAPFKHNRCGQLRGTADLLLCFLSFLDFSCFLFLLFSPSLPESTDPFRGAKKSADCFFVAMGARYCATSSESDHDDVDEGISSAATAIKVATLDPDATSARSLPPTQPPLSRPLPFHPPRVSSAARRPCCRASANKSFMLSYALCPSPAPFSAFALSASPA